MYIPGHNDDKDTYMPRLVQFSYLDLNYLWSEFRGTVISRYTNTSLPSTRAQFIEFVKTRTTEPEYVDMYVGFCEECNAPENVHYLSTVSTGHLVCNRCRAVKYIWCAQCGVWDRRENADAHEHTCCESPALEFTIRNDGNEPLANDTRINMQLPAGVVSDEGMGAISNLIVQKGHFYYYEGKKEEYQQYVALARAIERGVLDARWQTREGNLTKRLSRLAYKEYELKVDQDTISAVGNIARDHSQAVDFSIETTRKLNMSPEFFAHKESCWWQSYGQSRCALKTNGGFALRTFDGSGRVAGRAWVMPLRKVPGHVKKMHPTFDTLTPDGFIVFNGYRQLQGYNGARVLSHLSGMTYRKVGLRIDPMYVNSDSGYLVAPEEIAAKYTDGGMSITVARHSNLFQAETENRELASVI